MRSRPTLQTSEDPHVAATVSALGVESRRLERAAHLLATLDEALTGVADAIAAVEGDPALGVEMVNELIETAAFDGARILTGHSQVRIGADRFCMPRLAPLDGHDPWLRARTLPARRQDIAAARRSLRAFVQGPFAQHVDSMTTTLYQIHRAQRPQPEVACVSGRSAQGPRLRLVR